MRSKACVESTIGVIYFTRSKSTKEIFYLDIEESNTVQYEKSSDKLILSYQS